MLDSTVTITTGDYEDEGPSILVSVEYLTSLIAAKQELKLLKANQAPLQDAAEYLLDEHPDLLDYSGMTMSQARDAFPDLFDYDLWERDC